MKNTLKAVGLGILGVASSGCEEDITKYNQEKIAAFENKKTEIIDDTIQKKQYAIEYFRIGKDSVIITYENGETVKIVEESKDSQ